MEHVRYEQGYAVQARHIIITNEDCVKCIISIRYGVQARHIINCWKRKVLIVKYTVQIFPAFDELYLLIISVFNTTANVMYFIS